MERFLLALLAYAPIVGLTCRPEAHACLQCHLEFLQVRVSEELAR
jgi:hypothetical protein